MTNFFEVLKYNQHVEEDAQVWRIVTLCCELLQHLHDYISEWLLCDCVQEVISLALVKSLANMNYSNNQFMYILFPYFLEGRM